RPLHAADDRRWVGLRRGEPVRPPEGRREGSEPSEDTPRGAGLQREARARRGGAATGRRLGPVAGGAVGRPPLEQGGARREPWPDALARGGGSAAGGRRADRPREPPPPRTRSVVAPGEPPGRGLRAGLGWTSRRDRDRPRSPRQKLSQIVGALLRASAGVPLGSGG